uniref:Phosphatidylinositol Nacetylglucosaminyltransferase subunit C putative n=1 Tax=Albugo laibachii Nc14 TaxID=890382 RepID=F0W307_9STRA|nr:phosphatidylinositol Nacetylglucosaminyltransferase subunit C putative [Albugo laibachii Nc14]|eukprot:CCA15444.1 phosphatidylinositol Nacetylglucosaminyltransferase subunit C putative [Albugo laibachii Nc14]
MTSFKWCKTLYSKQPFPDNYVDESFLEQLRMNVNVREHEYGQMVRSMAAVAQQISTTLIFHSLFEGTRDNHISVALLGYIDAILPTFAFIIFRAYFQFPPDLSDVIGNSILFVSTLSILSPVLGTLTQTYADDTIRALGILFGLIHLLSHNYTYIDSGIGSSLSGTISMNAAMFTAVLQASRLQSNVHVFAFLLLAIELFALLPILQRQIKVRT